MPATKPKKAPGGGKKAPGELFLIDGNSLAYRAFFALPESIATHDGRPTNAIYGLASMFAKMLIDHKPAAVVVAWDAGWSGREKTYAPYKAQRKSRPDLLKEQWPHLMPLAEAFGFTNVRVDGFEADDVIASLVKRAREQGIEVMVVSGDRDVYQLVEDGVRVMTTSRGVTDTKVYDTEGVVERYGVPPELVTDLIGLKGDTSDNIPGVPGIGDKTAAQLLQEYGSLEAVLTNVDKISGAKRKQNLTDHAEDARISKRLATMVFDVDFELELDELMGRTMDRGRLREVAREFELRQIINRLEEELGSDYVPEASVEEELEVAAVEGPPSDLAAGEAAVAIAGGRWAAADAEKVVTGEVAEMAALAEQLRERPLLGHDIKSLGGGARHGLLASAGEQGLDLGHDTMVGAYLLDPARRTYDLPDIAAQRGLAVASEIEEPGSDGDGDGQLELGAEQEAIADPAAEARLVWELAALQRASMKENGLEGLMDEIEMPLVEVLAEVERAGVKLDAERLAEIGEGFEKRISQLEADIFRLAGREFTIGSPQQLAEV
ncbi:MAG: DNA polymerase I, partial [Actinomycetota bacterium]|nr:DNA polymerase I [Actinomycetota bacterium]